MDTSHFEAIVGIGDVGQHGTLSLTWQGRAFREAFEDLEPRGLDFKVLGSWKYKVISFLWCR